MIENYIEDTIGTLAGGRVCSGHYREGIGYPAIVYWMTESKRGETHSGYDGTVEEYWVFDCIAETYTESRQTADTLIAALAGMENIDSDDILFRRVYLDNGNRTEWNTEQEVYETPLEFVIQFETQDI